MSITYKVISDGMEDKEITIDSNTTVKEAIEKISLCLGDNDDSDDADPIVPPKPSGEYVSKVTFKNIDNDSDDQHEDEPVEIFGLSAYTDRSAKFNTIKFPNNELIVYPIPVDNLFLKSTYGVQRKKKPE